MSLEVCAVWWRHIPPSTSVRIKLVMSYHSIETFSEHHTCHYSVFRRKVTHSSTCLSRKLNSLVILHFKHIYAQGSSIHMQSLYSIRLDLTYNFSESKFIHPHCQKLLSTKMWLHMKSKLK